MNVKTNLSDTYTRVKSLSDLSMSMDLYEVFLKAFYLALLFFKNFIESPNLFLNFGASNNSIFGWMLKAPPLIPRDYISRASKISPREGR